MWGFKNRLTKIGAGEFLCPVCRVQRSYTLSKLRRWFTLFWVPLVPGKVKAHVVKCDTCAATFDETVLGGQPASPMVASAIGAPTTVPWAPPSSPPGYTNN